MPNPLQSKPISYFLLVAFLTIMHAGQLESMLVDNGFNLILKR